MKLIIFVNGLPMYGKFNETINITENIVKKYNNYKIIISYNSYNLIRTVTSATKNFATCCNEHNNFKNINEINNKYNTFNIKDYNNWINNIDCKSELLEKYYHPQWFLNNLAIDNFITSNSDLNLNDYVFIRIRPDRLKHLDKLIQYTIKNFSYIQSNNYYFYNGETICGFNSYVKNNVKDDKIKKEIDYILKNNHDICDQQNICNYFILNILKNFCHNIKSIHNSEKYKIMAEFCKTCTNYDLLVNNETKLSYYLELNNVKRFYIN